MTSFFKHYIFLACIITSLFPPLVFAKNPVSARQTMVVSEQVIASNVGLQILKAGGNAIDAAVAVGYALSVVTPCCGNIGGGGFMLIHFANGKDTVFNFREKAPLKASKDMFLDEQGNIRPDSTTKGYLAVAVPGTVAGLDLALKKYGSMTRKKVMEPAIQLAKNGYRVGITDARWFAKYAPSFRNQPNIAAIFLKNGQPYKIGELLIQSDLANTLTLIADKGPDAFYKGSIAKKIVEASEKNGGILSLKDFETYHAEEVSPVYCHYHGNTIISVPPPSSGGVTLCEMLSILEHFPLRKYGFHSTQGVHTLVEAMRYGFNDRNTKLGDPDFVSNPVDELLSKKYTTAISKKISETKTIPHEKVRIHYHEQTDTTHYSIIDKMGNAVSVTYTINGFFGAGVIASNTGFFLNDEMDDFTTQVNMNNKFDLVQSPKNIIEKGKRPLSSMTPTIVLKNNQPYLILGTPGGPRIITTILQTLINVLDYDMNIQQAIDMPRFHFQGVPDYIEIEPDAFPPSTLLKLKNMGYNIKQIDKWSAVEIIQIDKKNNMIYGANDKRRPDGAAVGY